MPWPRKEPQLQLILEPLAVERQNRSTDTMARVASKATVAALLVGSFARLASGDDFTGTWEVTKVLEGKPAGWSSEIKYPKRMTLEMREARLTGHYTDQWGHAGEFELVAVINGGRDLLLVHSGGTKEPESFSPIHHVKLVKGKLHGVVTSQEKLFEWVAERR